MGQPWRESKQYCSNHRVELSITASSYAALGLRASLGGRACRAHSRRLAAGGGAVQTQA